MTARSLLHTWRKNMSAWMNLNVPCVSTGSTATTMWRSQYSKWMVRLVFSSMTTLIPPPTPTLCGANSFRSTNKLFREHDRHLVIGCDGHGQRFARRKGIGGHRKTDDNRSRNLLPRIQFRFCCENIQ